ncbi:MAG: ABC transporter ATP-binding protein [Bacilli bacterium]|nr:ABC transporter ATP-binding protein [Bacilli bacterium]
MIKIENLSKYYHTKNNVTCALKKINLEFKKGEFVAITGESGSGKTTLLNVISGFDTYEDGEIYYKGKPTSYYSEEDFEKLRKEEIAFIFQNYNLIDSFTTLENVMSAFIIDGKSKKVAKKEAIKLLKLVDLESHMNKKAVKLSGGQKQRLAIARALAKSTDVIVADEPTGNLDVENGKAIMELLKKISKDKLVIVVTHNQEEIEPYITRKVRLHDGMVVSDEIKQEVKEEEIIEKPKDQTKTFKKALIFFGLEFKSEPHRTIFTLLLTFILTIASFVFIGTFIQNLDDSNTKIISDDVFINHDQSKLLITTQDQKTITDEMIESAKVKRVKSVEKYEYITDINYFRPNNYEEVERGGFVEDPSGSPTPVITKSIKFKDYSYFMRSSTSLTEDDLVLGRLPENPREVVLYSDDPEVLNQTEKILFTNRRNMAKDKYISYDVKIVGLLKENTKYAFFSEDLCKIMDLMKYDISFSTVYSYRDSLGIRKDERLTFDKIIVDYNQTGSTVSFNESIYQALSTLNKNGLLFLNKGEAVFPMYTVYYENRKAVVDDVSYVTYNLEYSYTNDPQILGVSTMIFSKIYDYFKAKTQFAVFLEDYAYTDDTIAALGSKDFVSVSCYRVSTTSYDVKKVAERFITLGVSIVSLVIICLVEYALCYALMKMKKKDQIIFRMIGMESKTSNMVTYFTTMAYGIISFILVLILALIINKTITNAYIVEFFKYVRYYDYLALLIITLVTMAVVATSFNKYMKKNNKIIYTKED